MSKNSILNRVVEFLIVEIRNQQTRKKRQASKQTTINIHIGRFKSHENGKET
jgi:hypothetical protein